MASLIVGGLLMLGSLFFFGTSIFKAAKKRHVAQIQVSPGEDWETHLIAVDPGMAVWIDMRASVVVDDEKIPDTSERSAIVSVRIPLNYQVVDDSGAVVHLGAGFLNGSEIISQRDHPSFKRFNGVIACSHRSEKFQAPASGNISLGIHIPAYDEEGNSITSASLSVYDQAALSAGKWAIVGVFSIVAGGILLFFGCIAFPIGIVIAASP